MNAEEAWHARYEAGVADWRTLRTQHAIQAFKDRVADEWTEPQPCLALFAELTQAQQSAHKVYMFLYPRLCNRG